MLTIEKRWFACVAAMCLLAVVVMGTSSCGRADREQAPESVPKVETGSAPNVTSESAIEAMIKSVQKERDELETKGRPEPAPEVQTEVEPETNAAAFNEEPELAPEPAVEPAPEVEVELGQKAKPGSGREANSDEFNGSFRSWANLKTDYGAVGNGKADDTAALQKALDDLWNRESVSKTVVYVPAGTYRITRTLRVKRGANEHATLGRGLIGEDPEKCVIRWDGAPGQSMILFQPWHARISRLTLDGAGKAGTCLEHDDEFITMNEFSDMMFKDAAFGIKAGRKAGIAETGVIRCRFLRCSTAAISIQNWNSLDWFIWYCYFEDCGTAVTNQFEAGLFYLYDCVFVRSKTTDIFIGNPGYVSMRRCISVGSRRFFSASFTGAASYLTFDQNVIVAGDTDDPINVQDDGHLLLIDNMIAAKGRIVEGGKSQLVSLGNTYSTPSGQPLAGAKIVSIKDSSGEFKAPEPKPMPFNPYIIRHVTEIAPNASVADIQKAVDEATALRGQRPVIHIPAGEYKFSAPLNIPELSDVQIIGDGSRCTVIGKIVMAARSRVVLKDLYCRPDEGTAITIIGDPAGSRIIMQHYGNEVRQSTKSGLVFDRLRNVNVYLADAFFGGDVALKVVGPGQGTEKRRGGRVVLHSGGTSNNGLTYELSNGGWLLVRDIWYETGTLSAALPRFAQLTGSGTFTLNGAQVTHGRRADPPGILIDNFRGRVSLLETTFTCQGKGVELPEVVVRGGSKDTEVMLLHVSSEGDFVKSGKSQARVVLAQSVAWNPNGSKDAPDIGRADPEFLTRMLEQARKVHVPFYDPLPSAEAGDVRLYRVETRAPVGLAAYATKPVEGGIQK
jgi:hypothetical protein